MNAAVVHSFIAPPRYDSFADPVPSGEEILVTVAAAGLHPIVKLLGRRASIPAAPVSCHSCRDWMALAICWMACGAGFSLGHAPRYGNLR